jgi:hypothetical protein
MQKMRGSKRISPKFQTKIMHKSKYSKPELVANQKQFKKEKTDANDEGVIQGSNITIIAIEV